MEAIQKLQFIQSIFKTLNLDFSKLTVAECFQLFDSIQSECKSMEQTNKLSNVNKHSKIVNNF